jgi:hypothetical protein
MGRYDSHKNPFQRNIDVWVDKKINDQLQRISKPIPCHVTAVDKDFVTVAFETHDNTFTPPTVKIPQSMSPYARDPTQVGDKGYAVPSNYYPRGNLTPLSFQPISHTDTESRDYDQYTVTGGPNGVMITSKDKTHQIIVDTQNNRISVIVPVDGKHWIFLGGDGKTGSYSPVVTLAGPSVNVKARIG